MNTTLEEFIEANSKLMFKEINLKNELKEKVNAKYVLITGYTITIYKKQELANDELKLLKEEYHLNLQKHTKLIDEYHYKFQIKLGDE